MAIWISLNGGKFVLLSKCPTEWGQNHTIAIEWNDIVATIFHSVLFQIAGGGRLIRFIHNCFDLVEFDFQLAWAAFDRTSF